jgi:prepilin-type processing-associated H-X9-DG protein
MPDDRPTPVLDYASPGCQRPARWLGVLVFSLGAAVALAVAIMPSGRCRCGSSTRERCASNLRLIGLATAMYFSNDGQMPQRLSDLLDQDVLPSNFICPAGTQKPLTLDRVRADPRTLDDPTYSSYTYVPLTPEQGTADNVLAFESIEHRDQQGVNVLFGDAHVEWMGGRDALRQLRDDYAAGVRPLRVRSVLPTTQP